MLHTVNKSPFERNTLISCLRHAQKGSAVLLIEDGVIGAIDNTSVSQNIKTAISNGISVYALGPDLNARGLKDATVVAGVKVVDYGGFVDLATEHSSVQSWL